MENENIIESLQAEQEKNGYISAAAIKDIARLHGTTAANVAGVATFYSRFRLKPAGKFPITVCTGTACHVNGAEAVLAALLNELQIKEGQTTRDGMFSLETAACLGCCSLSPVITVNGAVYGRVTPADARDIVGNFRIRTGNV